jgi:hypothetical protein
MADIVTSLGYASQFVHLSSTFHVTSGLHSEPAGVGLVITQEIGLNESEAEVKRWLRIIFIMVIVFAAAAIVHILLVKLILRFGNVKKFWRDVDESLFREKVIIKLISGNRKYTKKKSKAPVPTPSSSGSSSPQQQPANDHAEVARSKLSSIKAVRSVLESHRNNMQLLVGIDDQLERLFKENKQYELLHKPAKKERRITGEPKVSLLAKINGNRARLDIPLIWKRFIRNRSLTVECRYSISLTETRRATSRKMT